MARGDRAVDLVVGVICGAGGSLPSPHPVMTRPQVGETGRYFLERPSPKAAAPTSVNVILVDFRAFDTFARSARPRDRRAQPSSALSPLARRARASRPPSSSGSRPNRTPGPAARGDTVSDYLRVPSVVMQWMFPAIISSRPTSSCAATTCRAAASRPAWRSRSARTAVPRRRRPLDRGPPAPPARCADGRGLLLAAATGPARSSSATRS